MSDYINNNMGAEIGWDDEIAEESSFVLLEPGQYDFVVSKFERGRYPGGAKMCACNKVDLSLDVGGTTIRDTLYMNKKAEWRLSQFLIGIGMKKPGVPCRVNWNAIVGARGRCEIGVRTWTKNNGDTGQANEVKSYLEPAPGQQMPPAAPAQPAPNPAYGQQQRMAGYPAPGHWQAGTF